MSYRVMHRKVPSSHWELVMKWMSPEHARGEPLTTHSDVYSFCCLAWEVFTELEPWPEMTSSKSIGDMWRYYGECKDRRLSCDSAIPNFLHSLLQIGLEPDVEKRSNIKLQWMLRALQTKKEPDLNCLRKQISVNASPRVNRDTQPHLNSL